MSERAPQHHEQHGELEHQYESGQDHEARLARAAEHAHETKHEKAERVHELQHEAQERAKSLHEMPVERKEHAPDVSHMPVNRSVKEAARRRVMKRVQKHLRPDERLFSKITHNPAVDAVSRAAEKTVARPSGLLGGSFFAFLGSTAYLWIARHYGYEYNYLLFFLLFVGGFGVGMLIELLSRAVRRKKA